MATAAVALACLFVVPATAQVSNYNRIVSFGDSLSDNGNLPHTAGIIIAEIAAPSPPYDSYRFSNGPTWAEILAGTTPVGGSPSAMTQFWSAHNVSGDVNLAVGGARADNDLNINLPIPGLSNLAFPGVPDQIDAYKNAGGSFGENDLVTLWAGANDLIQFFAYTSNPTAPDIAAAGIGTAHDEAGNVTTLVDMGAKTILVANLPNLGATPKMNGDTQTSEAGTYAAVTYNTTLDANIEAIAAAAPGVNIVQMDTYAAFNVILRNPAAFGFTNITMACTDVSACVNGDQATQNKYLFWDSVHPTEAGHILLAQYANLLLSTGEIAHQVEPLPEVGLYSRMDAADASFNRALNIQDGYERGGLFAQVLGNRNSIDANGTTPTFNYDMFGTRAGFDGRSGNITYGVAVAYQSGNLSEPTIKADINTAQADAYVMAHFGNWFVSAQGGYSNTQFDDMRRSVGFGPVKALSSTDSDQWSTAVGMGTTFHVGSIALTPGARIGYVTSNLGGFSETADLLALQYNDREITSGFWDARLRASTNLSGGSHPFKAFAEVGYQDFFDTTSGDITAKLVNNTALPATVSTTDPTGRGAFVKLGIDTMLANGMSISAEYSLSTQNGDGEDHAGMVQVKVPLGGEK